MSDILAQTPVPQTSARSGRFTTFFHALLFVFGFSVTFVVGWGGAITVLGRAFAEYKTLLAQIGGIAVILFGLFNLGVFNIRWLNYDTRPHWDAKRPVGILSSVLIGVFFAAGWTPCIGTILGSILTLGFSQDTAGQAMFLSAGYALGLGIPFLLIGLGIDRAAHVLGHFKRHSRKVQVISGIFLIAIGILILTQQMMWIAIWAQQNGLWLDVPLGDTTTPTFLIAIVAGFFSFLSPCVLPLVPAYVGYLSGRSVGHST